MNPAQKHLKVLSTLYYRKQQVEQVTLTDRSGPDSPASLLVQLRDGKHLETTFISSNLAQEWLRMNRIPYTHHSVN